MSLIELMLILTLLGILTSVSWSSITGLRDNASVKRDIKHIASMLQEAQSKAEHSALVTIGSEECAMGTYRVIWNASTSPLTFQLNEIPASSCSTTSAQLIREYTLTPGFVLETTPYNLTQISYQVPGGNVVFQTATGTPASSAALTLQKEDGRFARTLTLDGLRGFPESPL